MAADSVTLQDGNTTHTFLLPTTNTTRQVAVGERMFKNLNGGQCCMGILVIMGVMGTIMTMIVAAHGCFGQNQDESTRSICSENYDDGIKATVVVAAIIGDIGSCIACCFLYNRR
jgi:hypothetical protein